MHSVCLHKISLHFLEMCVNTHCSQFINRLHFYHGKMESIIRNTHIQTKWYYKCKKYKWKPILLHPSDTENFGKMELVAGMMWFGRRIEVHRGNLIYIYLPAGSGLELSEVRVPKRYLIVHLTARIIDKVHTCLGLTLFSFSSSSFSVVSRLFGFSLKHSADVCVCVWLLLHLVDS